MAEIEKKWYVLRAISGKEAKVKEYLEADLKNSDLGEYVDRKSTRLNSSHNRESRMPSSA